MKKINIFLAFLLFCFNCSQTVRVGQWDKFELSVHNRNTYADPFTDVDLDVLVIRPDSSSYNLWGFYDGGITWRFRIMPDQPGIWRYESAFSDGTTGKSGTFECVPSDIPGMIHKDEDNPMWFGFKGGNHVLVRSFHVGDCFFAGRDNPETGAAWSDDQRAQFLDWAQQQGYNMLSIASHYLNRVDKSRGIGWNTPDLWNSHAQLPIPSEYARMEKVLDDLSARGIMVYPFAGFFGRKSDFPTSGPDQTLYIKYTLARLAGYWNILLMVGGPEPLLPNGPYLSKQEVLDLAAEIKRWDPYNHLLSVHNKTGHDEYAGSDILSYTILQGPKTKDREKLAGILLENHQPDKPLYAQETLWPGNKWGHPDYSDDDIRKNACVIFMSAAALNFADMRGNSSSGFSGTLDFSKKIQHRHDIVKKVWDFCESLPWYTLSPHPELVDNGYCLARPGQRYLVYLESPGTVNVRIAPGEYTVQWIDAQKYHERLEGDIITPGGILTTPEGGDDWFVYLENTSLSAR